MSNMVQVIDCQNYADGAELVYLALDDARCNDDDIVPAPGKKTFGELSSCGDPVV